MGPPRWLSMELAPDIERHLGGGGGSPDGTVISVG